MPHRYADLHMHTTNKFFFHFNKDWKKIKLFKNKYGNRVKRSNLNRYHQSHPTALRDNNVKLAHMTLLAGERAGHQADFWLFKVVVYFISGLLPKQSSRFYKRYKSYFEMTQGELKYIQRIPADLEGFCLVEGEQDLSNNPDETKVFVNVEGLHCFIGKEKKSRFSFGSLKSAIHQTNINPLKAGKTFKSFGTIYQKSFYDDETEYQEQILTNALNTTRGQQKIFSIGASHFEYNYILGQAWAIPIPYFLRRIDFFSGLSIPEGKDGLSDNCKELLTQLHLGANGNCVLFDLKHASVNTRADYYEFHKELHDTHGLKKTIPMICSHTGVSGYKTLKEAATNQSRIGDWRKDPKRKFNRWPINLCDEDIIRIHDSGGIIGIMVDRRLLGHFQLKLGPFTLQQSHYYNDIKKKLKKRDVALNEDYEISLYIHGVMFLENVFHVVEVIGKKEAWDTVCFGSDLDGNIKPIDCCPTYNHINDFREILLQLMNEYFSKEDNYEGIKYGYTYEELLEKFFYSNLTQFTTRVVKDFW